MNVDLDGRLVLVKGAAGPLRSAIEEALRANGAVLDEAQGEQPYALILVSEGANHLAHCGGEAERFGETIRTLAPHIAAAVTVMSCAALVPVKGLASFSAAEAGLERMTRALAMELGPKVRVNGVAVGAIEEAANGAERFVGHTALRRAGGVEAVAAAALFLVDPENTYMTGHTLAVDGGFAIGYARNF